MSGPDRAEADGPRRRGRRPAGEDTRAAILDAARTEFASLGYEGATIRGIARAAGVDARLVHHYYDGKDDLFAAALELPVRPSEIVTRVLESGGREQLGERLLRVFFSVWDTPEGRIRMVALVSSVLTSEGAARMIREFLAHEVLGRLATAVGSGDPPLRAALAASQLVGLIMARYVVRLEPLASADQEEVIALMAPTIQRYLVGE